MIEDNKTVPVNEPCITGLIVDESRTPNEVVNLVDVKEDQWDVYVQTYEKDNPALKVLKRSEVQCAEDYTSTCVGIGWTLGAGNLWNPPVVEPVEPIVYENIAVGSFYDRFGAEKWAILMSEDAMIKAFISDTRVRKYISLKAQDTIDGVNYIHTSGFKIDPEMILNTPIQPNELP